MDQLQLTDRMFVTRGRVELAGSKDIFFFCVAIPPKTQQDREASLIELWLMDGHVCTMGSNLTACLDGT
jgi:hypothetical protein